MFENNGTKNKSNMHRCFVPPRYVIWTHNKDNAVCWGVLPKTAFGGFTAATPSRSTRTLLHFSESNGYCLLYWSYHHQVALRSYNIFPLNADNPTDTKTMTGIILRKLVDPLGKFKLLNLFLESGAFLDTSTGRLVTLKKMGFRNIHQNIFVQFLFW